MTTTLNLFINYHFSKGYGYSHNKEKMNHLISCTYHVINVQWYP